MRLSLALVAALLAASPLPQEAAEEAQALWNRGQRLEAIERAEEALARGADGEALRSALISWELAVHRYESALARMGPGDPRRGPALASLGRCEEALQHLAPGERAHAEVRVECLHRLGRFDEAAEAARAVEELLGPRDPRVLFWRGRAAAEAGDEEGAITSFRAALEEDPIHMAALFGLGRALVRHGQAEEGRAVLARHRELVPLVDALDFARQGLDLEPTHAPNLAHLAELEAQLGLVGAAREHFREAEQRADPGETVPVALRHARFLEERGEAPAAIAVLQRALAVENDVRLRVRAGDVLARAGRIAEARAQYLAAQTLRPNDGAIAARLEDLGRGE